MKKKTFFFTLFILIIFGGGPLYCFRKDIEVPTLPEGIFGETKPILTLEEICELMSYDLNGMAGFLIEKGYKEKTAKQDKRFLDYEEDEYVLFPINGVGKIIFPEANRYLYIVFDSSEKEKYIKFLNQFQEIKTPLPKENEQPMQIICNNRYEIRPWGFHRLSDGYVVVVYRILNN